MLECSARHANLPSCMRRRTASGLFLALDSSRATSSSRCAVSSSAWNHSGLSELEASELEAAMRLPLPPLPPPGCRRRHCRCCCRCACRGSQAHAADLAAPAEAGGAQALPLVEGALLATSWAAIALLYGSR